MREMSAHDFRSHLKDAVEKVVEDHVPLRVKRRGGEDFVVVSAADWERCPLPCGGKARRSSTS